MISNEELSDLQARLVEVSLPTIGHLLDDGFCDPQIRLLTGHQKLLGRAFTVEVRDTDSAVLLDALDELGQRDILTISMSGDAMHAPVGAITATAVKLRGGAGIAIDGVATDIANLHQIGLPVYARGVSACTTKLRGLGTGKTNQAINFGGVNVHPGSIVLGDENGLLFTTYEIILSVISAANEMERNEIDVLRMLETGARIGDLFGSKY